jgi:D-aminoacyl-tRNA deacylase
LKESGIMRCVVQRVSHAHVSVDDKTIASIQKGLCVLVGVGTGDDMTDVAYMAAKLAGLRVFEDTSGKMNLDLKTIDGDLLLVSQFTLFGDARRGNRPSFTSAAEPETARRLYENLATELGERHGLTVRTGQFQAHMNVALVNDGPVTVLIDSKKVF